MPTAAWTLADWLAWQEQLHPKSIELGLERVRSVALRLGLLPARAVTLTIAGTNGKGSSSTLAAAICREAGYRTGLYTSPHLQRYNERVMIDGVPASDAQLCRAFAAIEQARAATPLTYFEFGTLAALWLFREADVQVQVLEVGLGGRLDAVNIVDPDAALITNIGLDHTDWLGADRESIGREKAGILRPGRPAVLVERHPPESVLQIAQDLGVPLLRLGRDYDFAPRDGAWRWRGPAGALDDLPPPALPGAMQLQNASGVLALLETLRERLPVAPAAVAAALRALRLPGRLQRLGACLLDVGHNAEAAEVLAEHLQSLRPRGRVLLVLGMLADKPVEAFARLLQPQVSRAFLGGLPGPRGLDAHALQARLRSLGMDTEACRDIPEALRRALAQAAPEDLVVVTGSFITVAAALDVLHE
ncbi:bifunctional tetrahydrofolate synthase/dihydrofolate synthase [Solimonas fluminis]|uniref:Dihydrofolate synthase/folylpolyglutamate synthase n=1 Tax=Solimonas fluminis TaxID=2086571 RepID=A0A2S5TCW0_9GAMM|nr:bifunctional tetrahydrofolate synthase/dihydrofolate synthase [Solimonas fluminis]